MSSTRTRRSTRSSTRRSGRLSTKEPSKEEQDIEAAMKASLETPNPTMVVASSEPPLASPGVLSSSSILRRMSMDSGVPRNKDGDVKMASEKPPLPSLSQPNNATKSSSINTTRRLSKENDKKNQDVLQRLQSSKKITTEMLSSLEYLQQALVCSHPNCPNRNNNLSTENGGLGIMVNPSTLTSCAHSFCRDCIAGDNEWSCPVPGCSIPKTAKGSHKYVKSGIVPNPQYATIASSFQNIVSCLEKNAKEKWWMNSKSPQKLQRITSYQSANKSDNDQELLSFLDDREEGKENSFNGDNNGTASTTAVGGGCGGGGGVFTISEVNISLAEEEERNSQKRTLEFTQENDNDEVDDNSAATVLMDDNDDDEEEEDNDTAPNKSNPEANASVPLPAQEAQHVQKRPRRSINETKGDNHVVDDHKNNAGDTVVEKNNQEEETKDAPEDCEINDDDNDDEDADEGTETQAYTYPDENNVVFDGSDDGNFDTETEESNKAYPLSQLLDESIHEGDVRQEPMQFGQSTPQNERDHHLRHSCGVPPADPNVSPIAAAKTPTSPNKSTPQKPSCNQDEQTINTLKNENQNLMRRVKELEVVIQKKDDDIYKLQKLVSIKGNNSKSLEKELIRVKNLANSQGVNVEKDIDV